MFCIWLYFLQNQDDSCIIDDVCYAKHKTNPTDVCSVCLPDHSNNTWSSSNGILVFLFRLLQCQPNINRKSVIVSYNQLTL